MKAQFLLVGLAFGLVFPAERGHSQISHLATTGGFPADFVGWEATELFPLEIRHNGNFPIDFFTNNSPNPRMRLTNDGRLGLNTAAPDMMFHVSDGGLLCTGTVGANPNLGMGNRFQWIPELSALRVGLAYATEWDDPNVGQYSFCFGNGHLVPGIGSVAFGDIQVITAARSMAGGTNNSIGQPLIGFDQSHDNFAYGTNNNVIGNSSVALGHANIVGDDGFDQGACALGAANTSTSSGSMALGILNNAIDQAAVAIGIENTSNGPGAMALGRENIVGTSVGVFPIIPCNASIAIGCENSILSDLSNTYGNFNAIPIGNDHSFLFGEYLQANNTSTYVIGSGLQGSPLGNSLSNSLMIGFNSDVPTLFVSGGNGNPGTFGNVGIGNITAPTQRLDVNGTARLRVMPNSTPDVLMTGVQEVAPGDYTLNYLSFTGDEGDFLNGNGEWSNVDDLCEWNVAGSDLVMGYPGACNSGRVGIGTSTPFAKLFVLNTVNTWAQTTQWVESLGAGSNNNIGIRGNSTGGLNSIVGVFGSAATNQAGFSCQNVTNVIGVAGIANSNQNQFVRAIGVYGESQNNFNSCGNNFDQDYAGYFAGQSVDFLAPIIISDNNLKTDVQDYNGGLNVCMNLRPKTYRMNAELLPNLDPEEVHYGFITDDVREQLAEIVEEVPIPVGHDENGLPQFSEEVYSGMKYIELIPVMVSAIQEQQAQINALSEQLAACCAVDGGQRSGQAEPDNDIRIEQNAGLRNNLAQNFPNPFEANTSIRFTLAADCHASICIYNSNGSKIDCLLNQPYPAGEHQIEWNTSDLAPGIYFYTLECDGFEQVRRAVKL